MLARYEKSRIGNDGNRKLTSTRILLKEIDKITEIMSKMSLTLEMAIPGLCMNLCETRQSSKLIPIIQFHKFIIHYF